MAEVTTAPISTVLTDQGNPEQVEALINRVIKRNQSVSDNRKLAAGGLYKALTLKEPDAEQKLNRTFNWLRAVTEGDVSTVRRYTNEFAKEYKGIVSEREYKNLAPQIEGTNNIGGYLVPPEFAADLAMWLGKYGYARQYTNVWQMSSNVLNISTLVTKPSVAWVAENAVINASKPVFGRAVVTANKLAVIYPISNELLADANIDVYQAILQIFAEAMTKEEDNQFFAGTGSPFTGLLTTAGVTAVSRTGSSTGGKTGYPQIADAAADKDAWNDLIYMRDAVSSIFWNGAKYFIDQHVFSAMLSYRDTNKRSQVDLINNGLTMSSGTAEDDPKVYFQGREIVVLPAGILIPTYDAAAHVSTPFQIFGNLKRAWCVMGLRGGVEVDLSFSATADNVNAFTNDLQLMRIKERLGFVVGLPADIVVLSTDAS